MDWKPEDLEAAKNRMWTWYDPPGPLLRAWWWLKRRLFGPKPGVPLDKFAEFVASTDPDEEC